MDAQRTSRYGKIFVRAGLAALAILAAWSLWWEPRSLVTREVTLQLDCWRGAPVRIAVVSDLHAGAPYIGDAKVARVVAAINGGKPDLVVLLGDYVVQGVKGGHFIPPERIAQHLSAVRAPLGVFAVLGNHDWWLSAPRVRAALQSAGIHVIEGTAVRIADRNRRFWLVGVSDIWRGPHDVGRATSAIADDAPAIVITHNPDVFPYVPRRVCLTLAGHTHGGQVALPLLGRLVVPSQYGQRYAIGHVVENGHHLFVTSGVGTSIIPIRFRVPPEVVFLTIR